MGVSSGGNLLRRRWRLIVLVAMLASVLAYAGSYLLSPSYSATTRVLVRARESRFLTSTGQDLSRQPGIDTAARALAQTHSGLVKTRIVAEEVVKELRLQEPRPPDSSLLGQLRAGLQHVKGVLLSYIRYGMYRESSPFEGAVGAVQGSLEAAQLKDSYLIEIKAQASEPQLAAAMADSAVRVLIALSRERFQVDAENYRDFLKGQSDAAQADVDKAQQAIRAYKEAQGIIDVNEELRLSAGSVESIRTKLGDALADLEGAKGRLAAMNRSLAETYSEESATTTVKSSSSAPSTTTTVQPNRAYQDLYTLRATLRTDVAGLEQKVDALRAALGARSSVLPAQEARLKALDRELAAATDRWTSVRTSYDQAVINSAQGVVEVSQADRPSVPLYPDRPVRYVFFILGLLLGAAGGTGLAYLRERRRPASVPAQQPDGASVPGLPPVPRPVSAARLVPEAQPHSHT